MAPFSLFSFSPRSSIALLGAVTFLGTVSFLPHTASAQAVQFGKPYKDQGNSSSAQAPAGATGGGIHGGEHFHAQGHHSSPPPGYQEAPSIEFQNGSDPDHNAQNQRDRVTGTNLKKFGTAYQNSNTTQSNSLGDATGNGWVAPRGNGW